jgi:hypothetical protein
MGLSGIPEITPPLCPQSSVESAYSAVRNPLNLRLNPSKPSSADKNLLTYRKATVTLPKGYWTSPCVPARIANPFIGTNFKRPIFFSLHALRVCGDTRGALVWHPMDGRRSGPKASNRRWLGGRCPSASANFSGTRRSASPRIARG